MRKHLFISELGGQAFAHMVVITRAANFIFNIDMVDGQVSSDAIVLVTIK
jgi:hypothetical protein